jgi:hypothetical protein
LYINDSMEGIYSVDHIDLQLRSLYMYGTHTVSLSLLNILPIKLQLPAPDLNAEMPVLKKRGINAIKQKFKGLV